MPASPGWIVDAGLGKESGWDFLGVRHCLDFCLLEGWGGGEEERLVDGFIVLDYVRRWWG